MKYTLAIIFGVALILVSKVAYIRFDAKHITETTICSLCGAIAADLAGMTLLIAGILQL